MYSVLGNPRPNVGAQDGELGSGFANALWIKGFFGRELANEGDARSWKGGGFGLRAGLFGERRPRWQDDEGNGSNAAPTSLLLF
mmetsp:Transcript_24404/g.51489  ORF Transcript_24404/g.51489 Transcript_24404/m.51489 type:complete len:84 (+) Transcript_24404:268-519(+)